MKTRTALLSCLVLAIAALLPKPALAQGNCRSLSGTIVASLDLNYPGGGAWVGKAYLTFGKDPTIHVAELVDVNDGYKAHPTFKPDGSGNFAGDEILTFTFGGGLDSFQMKGHFICMAGSTPNYYGFSEEGKLVPEAGTGEYKGMTGNISSHGSAAGGTGFEPPWLWISQLTGSVCK
jgi:hypothetical protein